MAIGVVGNLFAATPLALMNELIGWRACFLVFTLLGGVIVVSFVAVMRDFPPNYTRPAVHGTKLLGGLWKLFRMYGYWAISFGNFVRYGYFVALQGLWATPFLIYGLRLNERAAADVLLFLGFGYMFGLPFFGYISDKVLEITQKGGCRHVFVVSGGNIFRMFLVSKSGILGNPFNVLRDGNACRAWPDFIRAY